MFNQAVDFVSNLDWPNNVQHCLFETFLSKIIGEGIQHYCYTLEDLVKKDMLHDLTKSEISSEAPSSSLMGKARYQIMGGRGLSKEEGVPDDLSPEVRTIISIETN